MGRFHCNEMDLDGISATLIGLRMPLIRLYSALRSLLLV